MLAPSSFEAAAIAVNASLKRRDSGFAEVLCLALAAAVAALTLNAALSATDGSWARERLADGIHITPAGWWSFLFSLPVFAFLLFRGLWRHLVWSLLLRKLAGLKLRIAVAHPDGNGGLAFIGLYPNAYALFIFGLSSVLAAAVAHQFISNDMSVTTFGYIMAGWLAIVMALFAYPLSAFTAPLAELKRQTQLIAGAQATRFHRQAERKLFGDNIAWPDEDEKSGGDEVADSSKQFDLARKLNVYLINRSALFPVALAAIVPLVVAGSTKLPYKEILSVAKKLLLL